MSQHREIIAEIDENLERRQISAVEQAELIARRVEMVEARKQIEAQASQTRQVGANEGSKRTDGRGHRKPGGIKQTARDLGVPEQRVRHSLAIAGLPAETKAKAADLGLASNQAALLDAAPHRNQSIGSQPSRSSSSKTTSATA